MLRSADGPVEVELVVVDPLWIGWPGKADSAIPSWPDGIKSNVDWFDDGAGRAPLDTLAGSDLRA